MDSIDEFEPRYVSSNLGDGSDDLIDAQNTFSASESHRKITIAPCTRQRLSLQDTVAADGRVVRVLRVVILQNVPTTELPIDLIILVQKFIHFEINVLGPDSHLLNELLFVHVHDVIGRLQHATAVEQVMKSFTMLALNLSQFVLLKARNSWEKFVQQKCFGTLWQYGLAAVNHSS